MTARENAEYFAGLEANEGEQPDERESRCHWCDSRPISPDLNGDPFCSPACRQMHRWDLQDDR